jgi:hypothetical protein
MFPQLMVGYVQVLLITSTLIEWVKSSYAAPLLARRYTYCQNFYSEKFRRGGNRFIAFRVGFPDFSSGCNSSLQCVRIGMCGRWWPAFGFGSCHALAPVSSMSLRRLRIASRSADAASSARRCASSAASCTSLSTSRSSAAASSLW